MANDAQFDIDMTFVVMVLLRKHVVAALHASR